MQTISVRQSDILWQFYTKAFSLKGEVVVPPNNLCRYVQTALVGFGLWLRQEVRLLNLWLIFLAAAAVFTGMAFIDTVGPGFWIIRVVALPIALALVATLTTAILVSLVRLKGWLMERAPWAIGLAMLPFIGIGVYLVVQSIIQDGFTVEDVFFLTAMKWMLYVTGAAFAFSLLNIWAFKTLPDRYLEKYAAFVMSLAPQVESMAGKVRTVFMTIGHYVRAKKQQICPPVNPPEDVSVGPKA